MGYAFDLDDVAFLRSAAGAEAVAAVAQRPLTSASRFADVAAARAVAGPRFAAAALETAVLRGRAESKLDGAGRWLFTEDALQQATTAAVARHRARRLTGHVVHDVTCSIGADLREVALVADRCLGSDLDEVRLAMARHNLTADGSPAGLVRADALRPVSTGTTIVADPARRDGTGRRRWNPADLVPPLDELLDVHAGRDMVVKCAPGLDFDAIPEHAEVEIVSLAGQVREAAVWLGGLAEPGVRRRATVLRTDGSRDELTDRAPDDCPVLDIGQWIVDPDGAVVRAGLVRHYAARHGLGQLDPRIAYLTGDAPPPGIRAFRVIDHGKYAEKALRALLREHDVGRLEIMTRGVDVDPDALRRKLKPRGATEATAILTRVGSTPHAYLCRAERT
ncbi:THUMP-like domain-containing protein [Saccharopolyspora gloriosae]|uniref:THUMP-like domain-containing protein n=1 Tax=Saccharopolyspora gloriosae TaxID=455344 RepID=UPI001FB85D46|nr:class I SAM-dependent methyltransferase [Saccharopolyspora gloriosae]